DAGTCFRGCNTVGDSPCGAACRPSSTMACGNTCAACSGPGGSQPFCDAGTCDFSCQSGFMRMGSACISPPQLTCPNVSDVTDPDTYVDARLDPQTPGTLWVLDFSGQLLVSANLGQTAFTPVCRLPNTGLDSTWSGFNERISTRIVLSPGPDRTPY